MGDLLVVLLLKLGNCFLFLPFLMTYVPHARSCARRLSCSASEVGETRASHCVSGGGGGQYSSPQSSSTLCGIELVLECD